jgi:hypothetical protein
MEMSSIVSACGSLMAAVGEAVALISKQGQQAKLLTKLHDLGELVSFAPASRHRGAGHRTCGRALQSVSGSRRGCPARDQNENVVRLACGPEIVGKRRRTAEATEN